MANYDLNYLSNEALLKKLSHGLADTFLAKPKNPVEYMGKWLLKQAQLEASNEVQTQERQKYSWEIHQVEEAEYQRITKEAEKRILLQDEEEFARGSREEIATSEDIEDFFMNCVPHIAKRIFKISSVQVYIYDFPFKEFNLELTDDPSAHLDIEAKEKMLTLIAIDAINMRFLKTVLPIDRSSLYDLFKSEGEETMYIPDVVTTDKKIFFLDIPRLGAQLSFRLEIKNYYNSDSFDDLKAKIEKFETEKKTFEEKMNTEGEDKEELVEPIQEAPIWELKQYAIVLDNMGLEEEITSETRKGIDEFFSFTKTNWEAQNLSNLKKDVEYYRTLDVKDEGKSEEQEIESEITSFKNDLRRKKKDTDKNEDEDEEELNLDEYHILEKRTSLLKEILERSVEDILKLRELRFLKFSSIVEIFFILIGFEKSELMIPETNIFDWIRLRKNFDQGAFTKLFNKKYEGPIEDSVRLFAMTPRLLDRAKAIPVQSVRAFSPALSSLLVYMVAFLTLRVEDVKKRRQEVIRKNKIRAKKIAKKTARDVKYAEDLELAKKEFYGQESEQTEEGENERLEFDEENWTEKWNEKNPEIQIPAQAEIDVDNDIPEGFELIEQA